VRDFSRQVFLITLSRKFRLSWRLVSNIRIYGVTRSFL